MRLHVITVILTTLASTTAHACGGFFCNQVPIDQAGEQIIFHQSADVVTAMVRIQYTGAAEEFAWVVPVPGIPELSVGFDDVFQALETATRPQFNLGRTGDRCVVPDFDLAFALDGQAAPTSAQNLA